MVRGYFLHHVCFTGYLILFVSLTLQKGIFYHLAGALHGIRGNATTRLCCDPGHTHRLGDEAPLITHLVVPAAKINKPPEFENPGGFWQGREESNLQALSYHS